MAKAANLLLSGILAALFISADALKPCSDQDLDHIEELKRDSPTFTLHSPGPWEGKQQKHIPVLAAGGGRTLHFKVPHPTSSDHFISHVWAETQTGERFGAHTLEPGDNPEVLMRLPEGAQTVRGFAHCNTHGLWVAEHELSHKEHQGL
eukprot:TRINITY_DN781_c0_g1_i2.p2 TRINITY_DN781_c0_g1~~TRINITY_DN781_c0_g1_i2.p2  ORF type:complete len:149 (-),score=40.91 TRINITY_DN781_c0_g1_i2:359-805(-)